MPQHNHHFQSISVGLGYWMLYTPYNFIEFRLTIQFLFQPLPPCSH
jgi:hypothetical protein